ncbi:hypothetical protein [Micromonospora profundi]
MAGRQGGTARTCGRGRMSGDPTDTALAIDRGPDAVSTGPG